MVHFFDNIQYNKSKASDFIMDDKGDLDSNGLVSYKFNRLYN